MSAYRSDRRCYCDVDAPSCPIHNGAPRGDLGAIQRPDNAPRHGEIGPYTTAELDKYRSELPQLAAPTRTDFRWIATVDALLASRDELARACEALIRSAAFAAESCKDSRSLTANHDGEDLERAIASARSALAAHGKGVGGA